MGWRRATCLQCESTFYGEIYYKRFVFIDKYPFSFDKRLFVFISFVKVMKSWSFSGRSSKNALYSSCEKGGVICAKFPTVIFATAFKFHIGSVLLIDLVSSVLFERSWRGDGRAYRADVTSFAAGFSLHHSIILLPCSVHSNLIRAIACRSQDYSCLSRVKNRYLYLSPSAR